MTIRTRDSFHVKYIDYELFVNKKLYHYVLTLQILMIIKSCIIYAEKIRFT